MTKNNRGELVILPTPAAIADAAAQRFIALAQASIEQQGRFAVALSGGSTPRALHQRLAKPPLSTAINWEKVLVFWGDERFVAPDDEESCFRMARETLLAHVPIPAANIFPVPTVGGTPESAAASYAETLVEQLGAGTPRFDLILLGMGPDGHTASLFPSHPEPSAPGDQLVIAVHDAPKPPPTRISFTYKTLNAAANILFLVAGADKSAALREVLGGPSDAARLPAQGVRPAQGSLTWLVDQAAASKLGVANEASKRGI
jgi:6-phosphogluconolactonase